MQIELKPDRRRERRRPVEQDCKLFHRPSRRYLPATTRNLSTGGALIEIHSNRPLAAGEAVELLIDLLGGPILLEGDPVTGTIVRIDSWDDDRQAVALRFDRAMPLADAA